METMWRYGYIKMDYDGIGIHIGICIVNRLVFSWYGEHETRMCVELVGKQTEENLKINKIF